ncbi:MAG: hypothetical protein HYW47_06515 [Deltaproteobacteria bacterium]|nr:hypothetical protein [Deltaproteobacteria bacterium]
MRYYKSIFITIILFFSALIYAAVKTNQLLQQKYLYQSSLRETLITLDDMSFHDKDLFHRASLIAARSIFKEKDLISSKKIIESFMMTLDNKVFYTHGKDLIEYSFNTKKEKAFEITLPHDEKLIALSPHPYDKKSFLGVSSHNHLYNFNTLETKISPTLLEKSIFPDNVTVKNLWLNPINKNVTFLTNIENNSILSERSSVNWLKNIREITFRNIHYRGGLDLSLYYKALISQSGVLHVLNWEEGEIMHVYKHNKKALLSQKEEHYSLSFENNRFLLLSRNSHDSHISHLKWKKRNDLIVMNQALKVSAENQLKLEWKFFSQYYGEPRFFIDLELKKDVHHATSILGIGPLHTSTLEIPMQKPMREMKEAHVNPLVQNTSLHSLLSQDKKLVLKIAALDKKGKGIGSVQNFKIEPHNIIEERSRMPAFIQKIFIEE